MSDSTLLPSDTFPERIAKALAIAAQYSRYDGADHKTWAFDQMVRALTGCPLVDEAAKPLDPKLPFVTYKIQGKSAEYEQFVAAACNGEDGPATYFWNTGAQP